MVSIYQVAKLYISLPRQWALISVVGLAWDGNRVRGAHPSGQRYASVWRAHDRATGTRDCWSYFTTTLPKARAQRHAQRSIERRERSSQTLRRSLRGYSRSFAEFTLSEAEGLRMTPRGTYGSAVAIVVSWLEAGAFGGLAAQQEGFWKLALAANLERAEILIPIAVGGFRFRFPPELQLIQVFGANLALPEALKKVVPQRGRQVGPLDFRHYAPKVMRASSSLVR